MLILICKIKFFEKNSAEMKENEGKRKNTINLYIKDFILIKIQICII